jgi:hypothetical protein
VYGLQTYRCSIHFIQVVSGLSCVLVIGSLNLAFFHMRSLLFLVICEGLVTFGIYLLLCGCFVCKIPIIAIVYI